MPPDESIFSGKLAAQDFVALFDLLPEGLLLVSGKGLIIGANRSLAGRLKTSPNRLTGPLNDLILNSSSFTDYLRLCLRSTQYLPGSITFLVDGAHTVFRTDGALLKHGTVGEDSIVLFRLTPREASLNRFIELNHRIERLSQEIARRRSLEAELREQREWFQTTLSSIGDAVIATDSEGRVAFVNPVAEKLTGWRMQDALGQPLTAIFNIINEQTRLPAEDPVGRVLTEGAIVGLANHTALINKQGKEFSIEDSAAPIRNGEGRLVGVVLVFHDVSDTRRAERALKQSQSDLYERVRELEEFYDAVVGRELKMMELEKENELLRRQLEQLTQRKPPT